MKTTLTQKELVKLVYQTLGTLTINPKMPKKQIMLFVDAAIKGENVKWQPVAASIIEYERNKKLNFLVD